MQKPFYININRIIILIILTSFYSCAKETKLKLNDIEIENWNRQTLNFFKKCSCNKKLPLKLYTLYKAIKLNKRRAILKEFSKFKLPIGINKLYIYEGQCKDSKYYVYIWFKSDPLKRVYIINYNDYMDTLESDCEMNDHYDGYWTLTNQEWIFEDNCCEIWCPGILSEIYLTKDCSIKKIKIRGYLFHE